MFTLFTYLSYMYFLPVYIFALNNTTGRFSMNSSHRASVHCIQFFVNLTFRHHFSASVFHGWNLQHLTGIYFIQIFYLIRLRQRINIII